MRHYITGLMAAAVRAALLGGMLPHEGLRARNRHERNRRNPGASKRRVREPSGLSFRSLRRAVNSGWKPPQPDRAELERHGWYRRRQAALQAAS